MVSPALANPQLARINELYNLLSNSSSSDYLMKGEEPILEGLTPTLDLNLFREAQEKTKGALVCEIGWSLYLKQIPSNFHVMRDKIN